MTNPLKVIAGDAAAFHRWLQEVPSPKLCYDPACEICQRQRHGTAKAFDFHGDWAGVVMRRRVARLYGKLRGKR